MMFGVFIIRTRFCFVCIFHNFGITERVEQKQCNNNSEKYYGPNFFFHEVPISHFRATHKLVDEQFYLCIRIEELKLGAVFRPLNIWWAGVWHTTVAAFSPCQFVFISRRPNKARIWFMTCCTLRGIDHNWAETFEIKNGPLFYFHQCQLHVSLTLQKKMACCYFCAHRK